MNRKLIARFVTAPLLLSSLSGIAMAQAAAPAKDPRRPSRKTAKAAAPAPDLSI